MINMFSILTEKVDNMQEQMGATSREIETNKKIKKKCQKFKTKCTENEEWVQQQIEHSWKMTSELENMSIKTAVKNAKRKNGK